MSNLKHAPGGRWFIQPDSYSCSVIDENGGFIASLAKDAPASLIAAAPELLEALLDLHGVLCATSQLKDWHTETFRSIIGNAQAVIEKATGMKIEEVLK